MSKAYFITGTDTEVGKTFITAGLGYVAQSNGFMIGISKPISCGGIEDARFYRAKLDLKDTIDSINPVKFRQPLSPYAAMKAEKISIDMNRIKKNVQKLKNGRGLVFVEGLGGALAPVKRDYYIADMIKDLGIPAIIITRAGLGTINHTLMTIDALRKRKIRIAGIIMNGFNGREPSQKTNKQVIEELSGVPVIGMIRAKSSFKELLKQIRAQKILEKLM